MSECVMVLPFKLLEYLQTGVSELLTAGQFGNGRKFRVTQREALAAYHEYLHRDDLSLEDRLRGFFEIPTGIGKTAIFVGILNEAQKAAQEDAQSLRMMVVVPTRNLLGQVKDSFEEYGPELFSNLGIYGDGDQDLDQNLILTTYTSWTTLVERGDIGSHNVDILVHDEAHRGTSDRRVDNFFNAFGDETARIAVTATAHFDETKSVERTHGHSIYYKSLPDAVKDGELASYIQTQFYVVRVEPPEFTDEFNEAENGNGDLYKKMRQAAWNERAHITFREGTDIHTGELLSDNFTGFFTEGIAQANDLEQRLNDDEVLLQRAKDAGFKGVAVAIHSLLSDKERDRRLKSVLNGEYMALIGDEMFKEGFDYPPLKTVIDGSHGSLVDKVQILGRPARKWNNPRKDGRLEGATFVDMVVYVGDKDPEKDVLYRSRAIRKAVLAKDILNGSAVFNPTFTPPANSNRKSGGSYVPSSIAGQTVESHIELEDLETIYAERGSLRGENRTPITQDYLDLIKQEIQRTGLGPRALLSSREDLPEDLASYTVANWLEGKIYTAEIEHLEYVENIYKSTPDNSRISVLDEDIQFIRDSIERTGLGVVALMNRRDDQPEGLSSGMVTGWLNLSARTAEKVHLDFIKNSYAQTPDYQRVKLDPEYIAFIKSEIARTGLGPTAILKDRTDLPENMKPSLFAGWILDNTSISTAEQTHIDYIRKIYLETPDNPRVFLNQDFISLLESEAKRTGLGPKGLLKDRTDIPDGLTDTQIASWSAGTKRTNVRRTLKAPKSHIEYVKNLYAQTASSTRILITEDLIAHFYSEAERTGTVSRAVTKGRKDFPEGMNENSIFYWITKQVASAEKAHVDFAKKIYADLPDDKKISLKDDFVAALAKEVQRTGMGPKALFNDRNDIPDKLKPQIVVSWLTKASKVARTTHIKYVTELYAATPDSTRRPITEEFAQWIESQIKRTGMSPETLLKNRTDVPDGLSARMIKRWRVMESDTAEEAHMDYIKQQYDAQPDIKSGKRISGRWPKPV